MCDDRTKSPSAAAKLLRIFALILRLTLGIPLALATSFLAALSFDFALVGEGFRKRVFAALLSSFFALQFCAILKILIFRPAKHPPFTFTFRLPPDSNNGPDLAGNPVP